MENREQYFRVVRRCALAIALGLVALGLFLGRGLIANQFATSYALRISLTIQDRVYRPRLQQAVAQVTLPDNVSASFSFDREMWSSSHIDVSAPSREKAVAAARALGDALAKAYDSAGDTKLDVRVPSRAYPEGNSTSTAVITGLSIAAPLLGLLAIGICMLAWRRGRTSGAITAPAGLGYAVAGGLGLPVALLVLPGWLFMALFAMAIPMSIAVVIVVKMQQMRRASLWPSAPGRIVSAKTRTVKTKQSGGSPSVGNVPDIEYAYAVDGVEHRGKRISIGEIMPDSPEVEAALDRYQVGRTEPVFYNPDKPEEAVLERDAPASPGIMYAIAGSIVVLGLVVVVGFTEASAIIGWLQPYFPPGAIIHAFLFFLACGLVATLSVISNLADARAAACWPRVRGTVLSSRAESRKVLVPRGGNQTMTVWSPLIEYGYRDGTRDYHGSRVAFGPEVAGSRELAEHTVVRYPKDAHVDVHYDPSNPSVSTLETRMAFPWVGLLFPLAFFAAAVFFSGWLHF